MMLGPFGTLLNTHWHFNYSFYLMRSPSSWPGPGDTRLTLKDEHLQCCPLNRSWKVSMATHTVKNMKFHCRSTNLKAVVDQQPPTTSSGADPTPFKGRGLWHDSCRELMNRHCYIDCILPGRMFAFMLWWCGCYSDSQHVCLCAAFWLVEAVFRLNVCICYGWTYMRWSISTDI